MQKIGFQKAEWVEGRPIPPCPNEAPGGNQSSTARPQGSGLTARPKHPTLIIAGSELHRTGIEPAPPRESDMCSIH
ncbi:MAG: hypothetical protein FD165_2632 [Gammaproteobacteria bacterium]|nr:MAG: hypothetical protein FD165_2632 [Gammaproteobacteria bacterium]TND01605.1 MAG: hypothetical protein FD120_2553 [Gammaproteobacteria bacterium]